MPNVKNVILKKKVGATIYDLFTKTSAQQVTYNNSTVYAELASALAAIAVLNGSSEGSVQKAIEDATANLASASDVVSAIISSATNGALSVTKGGSQSDVYVNGVVTVPTYDPETRTLTLPYRDSDGTSQSVVMSLGKDSVVTNGTYNTETKNIELTISTGGKVLIPASSLIDVYTGETSNSVAVTVSKDNKISAEVRVSAKEGNALSVQSGDGEEGLFVQDLSASLNNKVDKVAGKGLSTNDLTDELLEKLNNAGDSSFSGAYSDLTGKPTLDGTEITGTLTSEGLGLAKKTEVTAVDGKITTVDGKVTALDSKVTTKARVILSATEPADLTEQDLWLEDITE